MKKKIITFSFLIIIISCQDEYLEKFHPSKNNNFYNYDAGASDSNKKENNNFDSDMDSDLCLNITCNNPPINICNNNITLMNYKDGIAGCFQGKCVYSYNLKECIFGCNQEKNRCNFDPCKELDIICETPPIFCDKYNRKTTYTIGNCYYDQNLNPYCEWTGKFELLCEMFETCIETENGAECIEVKE